MTIEATTDDPVRVRRRVGDPDGRAYGRSAGTWDPELVEVGAGIRCPYHGWLFAEDGQCRDQPCEPDRGRNRGYDPVGVTFDESAAHQTLVAGNYVVGASCG